MYTVDSLVQIKPQYATAKFRGVYRVVAVPGGARKRFSIESVVTGQKVDAYDMHIEPYEGSLADAQAVKAMPRPGTLVTYKGDTYVVTGATRHGARLALLGGNGKEWTNVSLSQFDVIPPTMFHVVKH
jgi:hypothetical protein